MTSSNADPFRLDGKVALVTGAKRGLGAAMCVALANAGADIIGVSSSMAETDPIVGEIRAIGRTFTSYSCDFSDRASVRAFIETVVSKHPRIDILVNNAGSILRKPAAEHSDEYWDRIIEINQTAPFLLSRELGRRMIEQGGGKIIFIASLLSFQGGITVPGYAASKGAVAQLTKALANEWASLKVNVNAIVPGYMATDNTEALRDDPTRSAQILARIPAGRWGDAEDIGGVTVFLASEASRYIHGALIPVDGGWLGR